MAPRPYSKTVVWASLLLLAQELMTAGQSVGWLTYQTTAGVGKEKYTFACDPQVGPGTGIEGRAKADAQFYAELWWSPATNVNPGQLRPVPGSLVSYRNGSTAGLINGKSRLEIPGTFGADRVSLQLRFWKHDGGRLQTWDGALRAHACLGFSPIFNHVMGGASEDGLPVLGSGSLAASLPSYLLPFPTTLGHEVFFGYCKTPADDSSWVSGQSVPLRVSDRYGSDWDLSAPSIRIYVDDNPVPLGNSPTTEVFLQGLNVGSHLVRVERWVDLACCGEPPRVVALGFASAMIHVLPASRLPGIERQPQPVVAGEDPVEFQVEAAGQGTLRYQWFHNGEALAGAIQPRLSLGKPSLQDEGYYSVRVSNSHGQVSSDAVYLSLVKSDFRSVTVLPPATSPGSVPDVEEAELWAGPQPDALSRVGPVSWPLTVGGHALRTVPPDGTAYVQLRGRRVGAGTFTPLSAIVWVPSSESEVQLERSAEASADPLQLVAIPGDVLVDHQPLTWLSRVSLSPGALRHELRKDGIVVQRTVGSVVSDSGLLSITNDFGAVSALDVGSYRAVLVRGREIWLSSRVKLALWLGADPYLFPPPTPGQRPTPLTVWNSRAGLYRIESSPNLLDWNQEALVRALSAPFQVYPVWRGHEARRFFRSVVLE